MSATATLTLAKTLKPKIGEKATVELIAFIEDYKHENLATKADLKALEIRLLKEINDTRKDMNANTWKIVGSIALLLSIFTALLKLV